MLSSSKRRDEIIKILQESDAAISAAKLADTLNVSRQCIVTDIALLRAMEHDINATPRGYVLTKNQETKSGIRFKVACMHSADALLEELYAIVDNGGIVLDVIVEHPVYGQIISRLDITSRYDADDFAVKLQEKNGTLLCNLTDGVHLHTIACNDELTAARIKKVLENAKILLT